jgi:hypothetical protein
MKESTTRNVILLEFNELSPSLMSRFMSEGRLPAFQRFFNQSLVYTTEARERPPHLDPWIQWVTVHTGLNHDAHRVERLNEGHTCDTARIWDLVSARGGEVWVCGSMNTNAQPGLRGGLIPDPWATRVRPTPEFEPFFQFVQSAVLDSTNARARFSRADLLRFLAFMASHGLSAKTVRAIVSQLLSERGGHNAWKRVAILDRLQFDLFRHVWRRRRPAFSTFFLNSTAHLQHLHWREMEPELFRVKPTASQLEEYGSAILYGYTQMDALLADVMAMAGRDATLVFATALSQQPCLTYEDQGGKMFYRPIDFTSLLAFAGTRGFRGVAPVMAHQFHVDFESPELAAAGEETLRRLTIDGRPVMVVERHGTRLFTWCSVTTAIDRGARLASGTGSERPFYDLLYKVDGIKSGMHHPDGLLWIRRPTAEHRVFTDKVTLDRVAPTLLAEMGIPPAAWMRAPLAHQETRPAGTRRAAGLAAAVAR